MLKESLLNRNNHYIKLNQSRICLFLGVAFLASIYTSSPVLIRLTRILKMPGTTSRKAYADFIEAAQGDICIIPSEIFADLVKEKQQRDERLCGVLNRIADVLETGEQSKKKHFQAVEMKMDQLIIAQNDTRIHEMYMAEIGEKLSNLTAAVSQSSDIVKNVAKNGNDKDSLHKNTLKLKDLRGQYLRSEKTSELIEELLNKDVPYVQRKYRVKLSTDTPNDEIEIYELEAVGNAKREIAKMKIRMKRWEDEINTLKTNINTALSSPGLPHQTKTTYEERLVKDEESNRKERDVAVKKIKDTYENEINSGAGQFLLKYVDVGEYKSKGRDESDSSSRTYRERPPMKRWNRPKY